MRTLLFPFLLMCATVIAQPEPPPISFALAEDLTNATPLSRPYTVELHFKYNPQYGFGEHMRGDPMSTVLVGTPLFADTTTGWQCYQVHETWSTELRIVVIADRDTMHLHLPDESAERYKLIERAWSRWDRATPEVIPFRPGSFAFADVIADPAATVLAARFAEQLIAEEAIQYKQDLAEKEEYYRNLPPPIPSATPYIPPPPMTEAEWSAFWAEQPPLKEARIDRVNADSVWVKISGRVMLNGGCGSDMPLFGIEMLNDTGWVERIPFDLTQMDCGMPWGDWQDHVVMLPPLRWWVGVHQPEGKKEVATGSYRLIFMGGNMQEFRTSAFELKQ